MHFPFLPKLGWYQNSGLHGNIITSIHSLFSSIVQPNKRNDVPSLLFPSFSFPSPTSKHSISLRVWVCWLSIVSCCLQLIIIRNCLLLKIGVKQFFFPDWACENWKVYRETTEKLHHIQMPTSPSQRHIKIQTIAIFTDPTSQPHSYGVFSVRIFEINNP